MFAALWRWFMKVIIRGLLKRTPEVVQAITVTPEDVGEMGPGAVQRSIVQVVTNFGTRDPKTVPTFVVSSPNVSAAFIPPNIVELRAADYTSEVDEAFTVEVDAP